MHNARLAIDLLCLYFRKSRFLAGVEHLLRLRIPDGTFWTWEVYSLGATLRRVFGLGWVKALHVGSDHGISLATEPAEADLRLQTGLHVTWSSWRAKMVFPDGRLVLRAQHPWVLFRKIRGYSLSGKAKGTLVFVPHSVPGLEYEEFSLEEFLKTLDLLPKKLRPFTLCLQFHDATLEASLKIAKTGYRFVTLGNSLSPSYADRFYSLIQNFEYATSPSIGSQLFYCHEMGVKYFLFNPDKKFERKLKPTDGVPSPNPEIVQRIEAAFDYGTLGTHLTARDSIVNDALGLDLDKPQNFGYGPLLESIKGKEIRK